MNTNTINIVKRGRGRPIDVDSALHKARVLYGNTPEAERSRQAVIQRFVNELNIAKPTAAAYYSLIRRPK